MSNLADKLDCECAEKILFDKHIYKKEIDAALEQVVEFLKETGRILVGGMAIDMALRMKGEKLYPDYKLPDYDFISPTFHIDAYDLGQRIARELDGVSVIRALHISTMKVRIMFNEAADITYIPESLYKNIPSMQYKGFTIVHPWYQMIDQHRALSLAYENPPKETITNRWKKDMVRHTLLWKHYPVKAEIWRAADVVDIKLDKITKLGCLNGAIALCIWAHLATGLGWKSPNINIGFDGTVLKWPSAWPITYLTDDKKYLDNEPATADDGKLYNPILDKIPASRKYSADDLQFIEYFNYGRLISAHKHPQYGWLANLQDVLCYTLTLGIMKADAAHMYLYTVAHSILEWAVKDPAKRSLFLPTVETYGTTNINESFMLMKYDLYKQFEHQPKEFATPRNAYPKRGEQIQGVLREFDPKKELLYQLDGAEIEH